MAKRPVVGRARVVNYAHRLPSLASVRCAREERLAPVAAVVSVPHRINKAGIRGIGSEGWFVGLVVRTRGNVGQKNRGGPMQTAIGGFVDGDGARSERVSKDVAVAVGSEGNPRVRRAERWSTGANGNSRYGDLLPPFATIEADPGGDGLGIASDPSGHDVLRVRRVDCHERFAGRLDRIRFAGVKAIVTTGQRIGAGDQQQRAAVEIVGE